MPGRHRSATHHADGRGRYRAVGAVRTPTGGVIVGLASAVVLSIGLGTATAWALWSDAFTNPSLQVATQPKVGISFERLGGSAQTATGPASVLAQDLARSDGQTLLASATDTVAIPLAVRMRADGHAGISYDIALPAFPAGTLFDASTVRLFPIVAATDAAAQSACTAAAAPAAQPSTSDIVGIAAGVDPAAPNGLAVDYWCLTAAYSGTGGTYTNTATASGTAPSGATAQGQDSWSAYVVAPGTYSLTHELHLPGGP